MPECPVCQTEYIEGKVKFCSVCGWDLTPYPVTFQIPDALLQKEKAKLAWARYQWHKFHEQRQQFQGQIEQLSKSLSELIGAQIGEQLSELRSQLDLVKQEQQQLRLEVQKTSRTKAGFNSQLELLKYQRLPCLHTLTGNAGSVDSIAIAVRGGILASVGDSNNQIKIWNLLTGTLRCVLERTNSSFVTSIAIAPDGSTVVVTDSEKIEVWDLYYKKKMYVLCEPCSQIIVCQLLSIYTKVLVSFGKTIKIWDLHTDRGEVHKTIPNSYTSKLVAISADFEALVSSSVYGNIEIWNLQTGKLLHALRIYYSEILSVSLSSNGKILAVSGYTTIVWDGDFSKFPTIKIWDITSQESPRLLHALCGHLDLVNSVAISPDGRYLASGSRDGTVKLWNLANGEALQTLQGHSGWVNCVAFDSHGNYLISSSADKTIKIWSLHP
jgi:WD40 repeat protein